MTVVTNLFPDASEGARSRVYETPIGRFTFQRVLARNPRAGVEAVNVGQDAWAFVASALRAIADLVYLRRVELASGEAIPASLSSRRAENVLSQREARAAACQGSRCSAIRQHH